MSKTVDFIRSLDLQISDVMGLPFSYRGGTSDEAVGQEILEYGKYKLDLENFQPKLIVDCGANIGYSTVFFANEYPDAQIVAIEPDKTNFKFLQYNTIFYDNVKPLNSALWHCETSLRIYDKETAANGYMTVETNAEDSEAIQSTTLSKILAEAGAEKIDLLKIDINGAEKEVFGADNVNDWISKVRVLAVVLHDDLKDGCSFEFFKAISNYKWKFSTHGDVLVFVRAE